MDFYLPQAESVLPIQLFSLELCINSLNYIGSHISLFQRTSSNTNKPKWEVKAERRRALIWVCHQVIPIHGRRLRRLLLLNHNDELKSRKISSLNNKTPWTAHHDVISPSTPLDSPVIILPKSSLVTKPMPCLFMLP